MLEYPVNRISMLLDLNMCTFDQLNVKLVSFCEIVSASDNIMLLYNK